MKVKIKSLSREEIPEWLIKEVDHNILLARQLYKRGYKTKEKVKKFLNNKFYDSTSPFEFPNMKSAVEKILNGIKNKDRICVYGDYDVDGVTATSILVSFLRKLGANVSYHIPDRFKEGYGMNKEVINNMVGEVDMILTCDCGISNYEEILFAQKKGIDVIVTDHHDLPSKLPPANYILSPKLLDKNHRAYFLPGAGMAFYFVCGILDYLKENKLFDTFFDSSIHREEFLDLLALAIVADVVPLLDENRYLLKKGLAKLAETDRPGLKKLFDHSGIKATEINEEDIAYRLGPIINAAGRLKSAKIAVKLMLTEENDKANSLAEKMVKINKRRKEIQQKIIQDAKKILSKNEFARNKNLKKPIILYKSDWHEGLLGIAAGRLAEEYNLPVLLMCLKEDENTVTGSARSIEGLHINNMLKKVENLLLQYGGHAGAAGFSLDRDNYTIFKKKLTVIIENKLDKLNIEKELVVDDNIELDQLSIDTYYSLQKLAPFGQKNPKPIFITQNCKVIQNRRFSENKHLRMTVRQNKNKYNAIWWWGGEKKISPQIDLVYNLDLNNYRGAEELQLYVREVIDKKYTYDKFEEKSAFDFLNIVDLRDWKNCNDKLVKLKKLEDAVYFYEGEKESAFKPVINRYQINTSEKLVLLSLPPSMKITREIIANNDSKKIILAFNNNYNSGKKFVNKLAGLIKYYFENDKKLLDIKKLAVYTGETEDIIEVGIKYLESTGYFWTEQYRSYIYLHKESHKVNKGQKNLYAKNLKKLLQEKRSYTKFMFNKPVDKILKYIQN